MAWAMMSREQRYLLDLQGFLVVESALSASELSAAREAMDRLSGGIFHGQPPLPLSVLGLMLGHVPRRTLTRTLTLTLALTLILTPEP